MSCTKLAPRLISRPVSTMPMGGNLRSTPARCNRSTSASRQSATPITAPTTGQTHPATEVPSGSHPLIT